MTHTPDCTCIVAVSLPDGVEPDDLPPVSFRVAHCSMHEAAPELFEACKAVLPYVGAIQDQIAAWIGNEYDKLPDDKKFSLSEVGFFDLIDQANELRKMVKAAIAKAEGGTR